MLLAPQKFGLADQAAAVKISFLSVAVWWFVFSYPLAKWVPEPKVEKVEGSMYRLTVMSLQTLKKTWKDLLKQKNLLMFMMAFWLYIDGVYTVMTMAVDFGISIGFEAKDLMVALLITQFIGFPCAYYFGTITKRWGTRGPILFCLLIYAVTVVFATQMTQAWHFYLLATIIGAVQGGVQSLSRSLFGRMIPPEVAGEYFGLFNLVGKFASILGPLLIAFGVMVTGSNRLGMMGLLVLFILGGGLLWMVKEPESAAG
jgi:UMF1 family MFS transporter